MQSFSAWCRARPGSVKLVLWASFSSRSSRLHTFHGPRLERLREPSFTPSDEQQKFAALCSEHNVVVTARPGSGKTATAEAIVAAHPGKRVIVLTYSKRLQLETARRLRPYPNGEVATFHAMAGKLFKETVHNDAALWARRRHVLDSGTLPCWSHGAFDVVVLDEFQDCTEILFWLVGCFVQANGRARKTNGPPARLVVLGDERQCIYQFRGADSRYLTLAPHVLGTLAPGPFVPVSLSRSFRLSVATVRFINNVFFRGHPCITSTKQGPKPIFIRCDVQKGGHPCPELVAKLVALILQYGAGNSAFIAPSVRARGPLQRLVNLLAKEHGVPIAVSLDDETPLDERVIRGKLCISTIHQFKGSERALVVVFGVDASFFRFLGRHHPDDRCPNEIFVALTRAASQLVLVHNEAKGMMPFMAVDAIYETATVINMTAKKTTLAPGSAPGRPVQWGLVLPPNSAVRDMTRHVAESELDKIVAQHLVVQKVSPSLPEEEHIAMRTVVPNCRPLRGCQRYQRHRRGCGV